MYNMIKRNGSTNKWRKLRKFILERDNYTCYYCGSPTANTCDHITPVIQGGDDNPTNLVAACSTCNYSKGTKSAEQFQRDKAKKMRKKYTNNGFFAHDKTSPTPAMNIPVKQLKTPFELPKGVGCND